MEDYARLIDFILENPKNKLTDKSRETLKEIAIYLSPSNKLKTKEPEWHNWDEDVLEDYRRMANDYYKDAEGWFDE